MCVVCGPRDLLKAGQILGQAGLAFLPYGRRRRCGLGTFGRHSGAFWTWSRTQIRLTRGLQLALPGREHKTTQHHKSLHLGRETLAGCCHKEVQHAKGDASPTTPSYFSLTELVPRRFNKSLTL